MKGAQECDRLPFPLIHVVRTLVFMESLRLPRLNCNFSWHLNCADQAVPIDILGERLLYTLEDDSIFINVSIVLFLRAVGERLM